MALIAKKLILITFIGCTALLFSNCANGNKQNSIIISVKDQKMLLLEKGIPVKTYPVSTSKFGLGSQRGSMRTPLGKMVVARKIGDGARSGAVFKSRKRTGEVLKPNAPGRDPIVSRIIWLSGKQRHNRNTYARYIYIHGTPEERNIGQPVSYGCIRMKSHHIIALYRRLGIGCDVKIIRGGLNDTREGLKLTKHKPSHTTVADN